MSPLLVILASIAGIYSACCAFVVLVLLKAGASAERQLEEEDWQPEKREGEREA